MVEQIEHKIAKDVESGVDSDEIEFELLQDSEDEQVHDGVTGLDTVDEEQEIWPTPYNDIEVEYIYAEAKKESKKSRKKRKAQEAKAEEEDIKNRSYLERRTAENHGKPCAPNAQYVQPHQQPFSAGGIREGHRHHAHCMRSGQCSTETTRSTA